MKRNNRKKYLDNNQVTYEEMLADLDHIKRINPKSLLEKLEDNSGVRILSVVAE